MLKSLVEIKSGNEKSLLTKSDFKSNEMIFFEQPIHYVIDGSELYHVPDLVVKILQSRGEEEIKEFIKEFQMVTKLDQFYNKSFVNQISDKYNISIDNVIQLYYICTVHAIGTFDYYLMGPKCDIPRRKARGCGIYKYLSFINHSCNPNAELKTLESKIGTEGVYAIKEINKDDEITINYMDDSFLTLNVQDRQEIIFNRLKFICTCSKCKEQVTYGSFNLPLNEPMIPLTLISI